MTLPPLQTFRSSLAYSCSRMERPWCWAGRAGFAAFLSELLGLSDGSVVEVPQLDPRLLVLCGSVEPHHPAADGPPKRQALPPAADPWQKLEPGYWASADGQGCAG